MIAQYTKVFYDWVTFRKMSRESKTKFPLKTMYFHEVKGLTSFYIVHNSTTSRQTDL
jgi:hypothetical protein